MLIFIAAAVLRATWRYDETQMTRKVRHRAPSSLLVGCTALSAALLGIYALMLLVTASGESDSGKTLQLIVALLTTALSWGLVHLLFALENAKLFYLAPYGAGRDAPPGGLEFPGGHPPEYSDFLYFSFIIGVACQTADVDITARRMRRMALLHGLIAFLFNTVILAATINVAASFG